MFIVIQDNNHILIIITIFPMQVIRFIFGIGSYSEPFFSNNSLNYVFLNNMTTKVQNH